MRCARSASRLHGAYLRLSREITDLFERRRDLFNATPADRHLRRRLLRIEPLEPRQFLSGDGLLPTVAPTWFQDVAADAGHTGTPALTAESANTIADSQSQAGGSASSSFDWIVQFEAAAVQGISSVTQVSGLLAGGGVEFDVIRGLGLVGQVLVRSVGSSVEAASSALTQNVHIAGFEQDIERQLEVFPNDPQKGQLYGMTNIDAPEAWNLSTGSRSVVVGIIDTGIDYTHSDLAANIWTNPGELAGNGVDDDHNGFVDDVHGYDFVNNDGNPLDDNGHGTHVAGTIAAAGNNGVGVVGVNWTSSLMGLKFLDGDGSGYTSDAIRAINYATMMRSQYDVNLRVLNNSWGGGGYSTQMAAAIQANYSAGILFVAAAGNNGTNNDYSPQYPANYNLGNVVSVAAVGSNDALASFSCYGASTVDLAAPGVSILSTVTGNRYAWYSGTSMATPHVAGAAALAWAYHPDATVDQVRSALLQGTDYVGGLSGKVVTSGRLNVYNTLELLGGETPPTPAPTPVAPTLGSLSVTPLNASPGADITLIAEGASDPDGRIVAVSFYADSDGNGTWSSADGLMYTDTTVINGRGEMTINTAVCPAGPYRLFARAMDNDSLYSSAQVINFSLVSANPLPPTLGTLTMSPGYASPGAIITFAAEGASDPDGRVVAVSFYADSDGNGTWSSADGLMYTDTTVVNGRGEMTIDTSGCPADSYRLFARAMDNDSLYSDARVVNFSLVAANPASSSQPAIGALIASPGAVAAGASVVLQAQDAYDPNGRVTAVYYYQDANGNGVWDSRDLPIGTTTAVSAGTANLNLNTSALCGTYTFFARALDNNYQFSTAASTRLTVNPRAGSHAASATDWNLVRASLVAAQSILVTKQDLSGSALFVRDAALHGAFDQVLASHVLQERELDALAGCRAIENSSLFAESGDGLSAGIASAAAERQIDVFEECGEPGKVFFARIASWEEPAAKNLLDAGPATRELLAAVDRLLSGWGE